MRIIKNKQLIMLFITILMLGGALISSIGPTLHSVQAEQDNATKILCRFEDGQTLANLRSTDYFHYLFRSKSAVTSIDGVSSSWLNKMLTVAGYEFITPNELILGREINPSSIPEDPGAVNQGPKVSAFDRFGMAGLKWSSYQGEWKYNHVNACASQNRVSPTNYGSFYEGRLEPKSTHNEVSTSKDPRTIQFDKGVVSLIGTAVTDTISNGLFAIAKGIVTLTIVFVGLAFTDITTLMGLAADGTAGTTAANIFLDLFNTIFSGFVIFAFFFTAMYLLYNGLIKRQIRLALGTLIKTILIFIMAIIMSTNPSFWISAPNKVANYGQALVLSSMAGMYEKGDTDTPTLCNTEIGSIDEGVNIDSPDEASLMTEFEKVNKNMRSLIGCQMWEQLLFKPWVRGQFGTEYENLENIKVNNINSDWVGNGSVPLGDGQTIDNWALFHLSTQTDVHAQIGDSNFPTLINGVNADWWRTVDALSNYDEAEVSDSIGGGAFEGTYIGQIQSDPIEYWQSWIGNNSTERIMSSIIAVAFAIAGSIAPMIFALSSAIFGLGITLLMMTSPLFLLLGTWGGKGDKIFTGWLSALFNTVIKRIGVSILLILSIAITMNIMELAYTVGIVKSFILMIIITMLLIKNKNKLLDMLASVDFGGAFDPRTKANQFLNTQNRRAKSVGKVGLATAAGAKAGIQTGQGAFAGAKIGAQSQLRNAMYQSPLGMSVVMQLDVSLNHERTSMHHCSMCAIILGKEKDDVAYRDEKGNYYCIDCADELGVEDLYEVIVGIETDEDVNNISKTRTYSATKNRSHISHEEAKTMMGSRIDDGKYYWDNDGVQDMIKGNIKSFREDSIVFSNIWLQIGKKARPPSPPEPLNQYIDIALINKAWTEGNVDAVERTYKEAWKTWYEDNAKYVEGVNQEDIDKFKKEIENYNPDISYEDAKQIMDDDIYDRGDMNEEEIEKLKNKDLYIYRNGELVFNVYESKDSYD